MANGDKLAERLGHQGIDRNILSVHEPESILPEGFFRVSFTINGKPFERSVDWLLSVESEAHGEPSDVDLEVKLSRIAYNAFTFAAAREELEATKKELEHKYAVWQAGANAFVKTSIIKDRNIAVANKEVSRSWFGSITKQDLLDAILLNLELRPIYEDFQKQLIELEKNISLCESIYKIILAHGDNLRGILYSRSSKPSIQGDYRRGL